MSTRAVGSLGRSAYVSVRAVSSFAPPVTSGLVSHYAARMERFSDADSVGTFTDQWAGDDVTQATSSAKPTYQTNVIGGHPVLRFDGTDDEMTGPTLASTIAQPWTIIVVGAHIAHTGSTDPWTDGADGTNRAHAPASQITSTTNWHLFFGTVVDTGTATDTAAHIFLSEANGASSFIRQDGTQIGSGDAGGGGYNGIHFGSNTTAGDSDFANYDLAECLIYDRSLTSSEQGDMESWLNTTVGYSTF